MSHHEVCSRIDRDQSLVGEKTRYVDARTDLG